MTWPTTACSACFLPHPASSIATGSAHAIAAMRHRRRDIGVICSKTLLLSTARRRIDAGLSRNRDESPSGREFELRAANPGLRPNLLTYFAGFSHRRMCRAAVIHNVDDIYEDCNGPSPFLLLHWRLARFVLPGLGLDLSRPLRASVARPVP